MVSQGSHVMINGYTNVDFMIGQLTDKYQKCKYLANPNTFRRSKTPLGFHYTAWMARKVRNKYFKVVDSIWPFKLTFLSTGVANDRDDQPTTCPDGSHWVH